jgi:predicted Zn-dependent protease
MPHRLWSRAFIPALILLTLVFAKEDPTLTAMKQELNRSYANLSKAQPVPLYFLEYEIWDDHQINLTASLGALITDQNERHRNLNVDARVGSPKLDNTHEIRGGGFDFTDYIPSNVEVPVDENADALKAILWAETDRRFKSAQEKYTKVLSERQVKVLESDTSADFTRSAQVKSQTLVTGLGIDVSAWRERLKKFSATFRLYPWILSSTVSLTAATQNRYIVNTDQSEIIDGTLRYNLRINASTMADDGMELNLGSRTFATSLDRLPDDQAIAAKIDSLIRNLDALRKAPMVEPYSGPAIMMAQACGVFFHEIFGHRIEGHRQKSEFEGQTFTKKINEPIMPDFISVFDDPTMAEFNGRDLNGHYDYDDEGVASQNANIVDKGILKGFLLSRSPIARFPVSNGHGRRSYGNRVVTRQGVLCVKSTKEVPIEELRAEMIRECQAQNKPYGLIFYDISGGFTSTGREGTQSFKVIPLFVKRVYVDGRPDEVVRGVDIVGTPLLSLSKIALTGDDYGIFNGTCGAESGWVPVSAIAPSILVSEIEVEKKAKGQDKPPILPAPADVE